LALEAEQSPLVSGLNQLVHHGGGGGEADRQTLLTGSQSQSESDVRLPSAARSSDILPGIQVLKSRSAIPFTPAVAKPSQCSGSSAMLAVNTLSSGNPIGR